MANDSSKTMSSVSNIAMKLHRNASALAVLVFLCCSVQVVFCYSFNFRFGGTSTGKIRPDLPGVELSDYRFGLGDPYVMFYEKDNYKGSVYFQILGRTCKNLPEARQNWASSIDVQKRCITICDELDCSGNCAKVYAHPEDPNNKGASKLSLYNLNDRVKSLKFCYL